MTSLCKHNSQIDDFGTGDVVCTDCGLVMDQIYCSDYHNSKWNAISVNRMNYNPLNNSSILGESKNLVNTK